LEKEELKRLAAEKAVENIEDGMIVGLGSGSTAEYAIKKLGQLVRTGLQVKGIPSSLHTQRLAAAEKIPLTTFEECPEIDMTIDGADEVDSNLNLIKGGGGALTREKMIAFNSKKVIIVIDDSKIVKALGIDFPLPVEVTRFGWTSAKRIIEKFDCVVELRKVMGSEPFITDNGNYVLDCEFDKINDPVQMEQDINMIPGVVENGLFIGLVDEVIVGGKQGIMTLEKETIV
jgi:ribose 5-phosphate isomerase A